jgi:hypothetical protein
MTHHQILAKFEALEAELQTFKEMLLADAVCATIPELFVIHALRDGKVSEQPATKEALSKALSLKWDIVVNEKKDTLCIAGKRSVLSTNAQTPLGLLYLILTRAGLNIHPKEFLTYTNSLSDTYYQFPRILRKFIGDDLAKKILLPAKNHSYPVSDAFSFCWIRPCKLSESLLLINTDEFHKDKNLVQKENEKNGNFKD